MRQIYNRGGPGLPNLGFFQNSFFTSRNAGYATSRGAPSLPQPVPAGQLDSFFTYDCWVVPTSWYGGLFDQDLWEVQLRSKGKDALKMGPLKYGTRTVEGGSTVTRITLNQAEKIVQVDDFEDIAISVAASEAQRATQQGENSRRSKGQSIREALSLRPLSSRIAQKDQYGNDDGDGGDFEVRVPEIPLMPTPTCPRYDEIKKYLFANRDLLELALDTMRILPESTFYRYIRDHGGIDVSAHELRSFLHMASDNRELFM